MVHSRPLHRVPIYTGVDSGLPQIDADGERAERAMREREREYPTLMRPGGGGRRGACGVTTRVCRVVLFVRARDRTAREILRDFDDAVSPAGCAPKNANRK